MSSLSAQEVRRRLDAVNKGPWADSLELTHRNLSAPDPIDLVIQGTQPIRLDTLRLSAANRKKNERLAVVLRSHLDDEDGVTDQDEIDVRDALDETLTVPQLYELAVQTGYLPAEAVRQPSRALFTNLLWSPAARQFVSEYDYVALPMLAARVEISGFPSVKPPNPDDKAALRFAGFLAHLRAFCQDEKIGQWTRFLDDYAFSGEQEGIRRYLRGKSNAAPARTSELLTGCVRFVASLASAFFILDDDELGRFGMFHAFWLQKFFGYKRVKGRYVKNVEVWGRNDSWAHTVATSRHLTDGADEKLAKVLRRQFNEDTELLERAFESVRRLSDESRRAKRAAGTRGRRK